MRYQSPNGVEEEGLCVREARETGRCGLSEPKRNEEVVCEARCRTLESNSTEQKI